MVNNQLWLVYFGLHLFIPFWNIHRIFYLSKKESVPMRRSTKVIPAFTISLEKNGQLSMKEKLNMTAYYTGVLLLSHFSMLLMMTYNMGVILAIIFGNGVGYFLFGTQKKVSSSNKNNSTVHC
jgi:hypothetical protein